MVALSVWPTSADDDRLTARDIQRGIDNWAEIDQTIVAAPWEPGAEDARPITCSPAMATCAAALMKRNHCGIDRTPRV